MPLRVLLLVLQAVATAAAIAGLSITSSGTKGVAFWAIGGVLVFLQLGVHYITIGRFRHHLEEGTPKFGKFFQQWYSCSGTHFIYCDDLEWLEPVEHAMIVDQLKRNASGVEVWIRRDDSPRVAELRADGVNVRVVPDVARLHVSLSLHVDGGARRLIVRGKTEHRRDGKKRIEFVQTDEANLVALAREFFALCGSQPPS